MSTRPEDVSRETPLYAQVRAAQAAAARPVDAAPPSSPTSAAAGPDAIVLPETRTAPLTSPPVVSRETRIVTVANQKGGVGKTTTTVNLGVALARAGARVLAIDLDPQGNASTGFGIPHTVGTLSSYDVLVAGRPVLDVAQPAPEAEGLSIVPATIDLAGAEVELVPLIARESRLRKALTAYLADVPEKPDYVLIDCPPSLGLLTVNAFVAATEVLIPIQCEYYALEGLGQLTKNVELIKAHLNPRLELGAILLTMYDARTRLAEQVANDVREHFGDLVLHSVIPRSVRLSEAPSYGQSVLTYDPTSRGALAYLDAARELLARSSLEESA